MGHISLVLLVIFLLGFICLAPLEARKLLDKEEKHLDHISMLEGNLVLNAPPKDTLLPHEGLSALHLVHRVSESVPSPGAGHLERGLESVPTPEVGHEGLFTLHLAHGVSGSVPSPGAGHLERGLESVPSPGSGHLERGLESVPSPGAGHLVPKPGARYEGLCTLHLAHRVSESVPSLGAGHSERGLKSIPSSEAGHLEQKLESVPSPGAGHKYTSISPEN